MKKNLISKIESLPPLPETVTKLEMYRKRNDKESDELITIIEEDPLIITTILKIANSAMFGFRHKVETPARAVSLLGINFSVSIALSTALNKTIKNDLYAYGIDTSDFLNVCNLSTLILTSWLKDADERNLKEELLLPAFLQETGKFVISELICEANKAEEFRSELTNIADVAHIERKYTGYSCAKITANIFKHWQLSNNLIFSIGFVGDLTNCPDQYIKKAQILEVIKILCNITTPLSEKSIQYALEKAKDYNLNINALTEAIEITKNKFSKKDK